MVGSTEVCCEPNATSDAVDQVLTQGSVAATIEDGFLVLRQGTAVLALRPVVGDEAP